MNTSMTGKKAALLCALFIITAAGRLNSRVFSPDTRILIFDFLPIGVSETESRTVTELISAKIVKHHVFTVIDRTHFDSILKEHELQRSGFTSHEERMKLGKMLNSEKIMHGSVSRMNSLFYVTIKITDVVKGTVEWSDAVKMKDLSLIDEYITLYLQKIVRDEEIGSDIFIGKEKKNAKPSEGAGSGTMMKNEKTVSLEPAASRQKQGKNSWYWGFGVGGGKGKIAYDDGKETSMKKFARPGANEAVSYGPLIDIDLGIGLILSQELHLGLWWSMLSSTAYISRENKTYETEYSPKPRTETLTIGRFMPVITYFPFSHGVFYRGGVGLATLQIEKNYYTPESTDTTLTSNGVSIMAGTGLAIPVYRSYNISLNLDYKKEFYGKEVRTTDALTFSVSMYWF